MVLLACNPCQAWCLPAGYLYGQEFAEGFYRHLERWVTLGKLYARIRKSPGEARILASVVVKTKLKQQVKIVFVRHHRKRQWLAIISTKIARSVEEIVRIYGKRCGIEVLFKMMKHLLNLEKEAQLRDYDGIIGHTTIAMIRFSDS